MHFSEGSKCFANVKITDSKGNCVCKKISVQCIEKIEYKLILQIS